MKKNKLPVRFTGQHFTIDKRLIADAIDMAKIQENDTVLDIGAGKGFLTVHLSRRCNSVIAIENDQFLVGILRKKFASNPNIEIIARDFRNYTVPNKNFKVVSNIPFRITSDILKSLMFDHVGNFLGGSLVIQLEVAQKLFSEKVFNPYAVFYRTYFDLKLVYEIAPESFMPPPKVKSVLLAIRKKEVPLVAGPKEKYLSFLFYFLQKPELQIRTALKKLFRKSQIREISEMYVINHHCIAASLTPNQWAGCFLEMLDKVPEKYHPV